MAGGDEPGTQARTRVWIEPRFRQRRIQVMREEGRRRLRLLVSFTAALVLFATGFGMLRTPLFAVRHVRVVGASHAGVATVVHAAGLGRQGLMIDLRPGAEAAAVDRLPWVRSTRVRREWPDTVKVTVTERVAVAQISTTAGAVLVDGSGRLLAEAPAATALPVLSLAGAIAPAPSLHTPALAPAASPASSTALGSFLGAPFHPGVLVAAALPPALVPRVLGIVIGAGGRVRLELSGGASAKLGEPSDLARKLEAVLTLVERVRIGSETIDATVPNFPVLTAGQ